ncbi:MAG: DUF1080 domain-containing protein [Planctomycetaceae bacterium]|nr:DUF1080 domain-containing protein [Planctomycetaceae bacterium]
MKMIAVMLVVLPSLVRAAEVPAEPLAEKGELVFTDDFEREGLGEWKALIPGFSVNDGVLKGWQAKDDHGAVGRVYRPMKDAIVEFKFKLDGSNRFNVVFDDKNYKGSHAGHIARVAFSPAQIRLGDDKEGIMRNDIFAMRRDPKQKAKADELIKDRGSVAKVKVDAGKWHHVVIEIVGDRMRVSFDGEPVGYLQSPGLAHPTKESVHFTVNGSGVLYDNVKIWKAK